MKPAVSAGLARHRALPGGRRADAPQAHVARLHADGRAAMAQPYMAAVEDAGETAVVHIGGALQPRRPQGPDARARPRGGGRPVRGGGHRAGRGHPGEPRSPSPRRRWRPCPAARADLLYARVDLVPGPDGAPLVIELELLEPSLFLAHVAGRRRPPRRRHRRRGSPAAQADAVAGRRRQAGGGAAAVDGDGHHAVAVHVHQHPLRRRRRRRPSPRSPGGGARRSRRRCGRRGANPARSQVGGARQQLDVAEAVDDHRGRARALPGPTSGGGRSGSAEARRVGRLARARRAARPRPGAPRPGRAGPGRGRSPARPPAGAAGRRPRAAPSSPGGRPQQPVVGADQRPARGERHGDRARGRCRRRDRPPRGPRRAGTSGASRRSSSAPARTSPGGQVVGEVDAVGARAAGRHDGVQRARRARCPARSR